VPSHILIQCPTYGVEVIETTSSDSCDFCVKCATGRNEHVTASLVPILKTTVMRLVATKRV